MKDGVDFFFLVDDEGRGAVHKNIAAEHDIVQLGSGREKPQSIEEEDSGNLDEIFSERKPLMSRSDEFSSARAEGRG